jgi:hypothetical protein
MKANNIIDNDLGLINAGWIQPSIKQGNVPFSGETIIDGLYAATPSVKNIEIKISDQSWFWTDTWQLREAEADKDIAEGRFTSHDNMDDFIADIKS